MFEKENAILDKAIRLIDGKWNMSILCELSDGDSVRFGVLKRNIPGISQRILTLQLRDLEKHGIVKRIVHAEIPPRVEYKITPRGKSLERIYISIMKWGRTHLEP